MGLDELRLNKMSINQEHAPGLTVRPRSQNDNDGADFEYILLGKLMACHALTN